MVSRRRACLRWASSRSGEVVDVLGEVGARPCSSGGEGEFLEADGLAVDRVVSDSQAATCCQRPFDVNL